MKKIFSFAIVLTAAALVSCGGNNASKPAEAEAKAAAEQCDGCCDKAEGACCEKAEGEECCGEGECAKKADGECCKKAAEGECEKACCQEKAE